MVALLRDVRSDEPCGLHRTFLDARGNKLGRRMLGRARHAAVQLDPGAHVVHGLAICEGVETGLAARSRYRPLWALGSAGGIRSFPVLAAVECLVVFADADATGQEAARRVRRDGGSPPAARS